MRRFLGNHNKSPPEKLDFSLDYTDRCLVCQSTLGGTMKRLFWRAPSRNQLGMTLMEVLISVGLLSIVGVGFGTFVSNANKQQRVAENRIAAASTQAEVTSLLADPIACANSLKGLKPADSPKNVSLKSEHNALVYVPNTTMANTQLKVEDISLTADPTLPTKFANVNVTLDAHEGDLVMRARTVRIGITLDASGKIDTCSSVSSFISEAAIAEAVKRTLASMPACPTDHYVQSFDSKGSPVCVKVIGAAAPSPCGGTLPFASVVRTVTATDAVYFGLTCGKASGDSNKCYSCKAEWVYNKNPATNPGPYTVECQCR